MTLISKDLSGVLISPIALAKSSPQVGVLSALVADQTPAGAFKRGPGVIPQPEILNLQKLINNHYVKYIVNKKRIKIPACHTEHSKLKKSTNAHVHILHLKRLTLTKKDKFLLPLNNFICIMLCLLNIVYWCSCHKI